jgi:hypothetical protein
VQDRCDFVDLNLGCPQGIGENMGGGHLPTDKKKRSPLKHGVLLSAPARRGNYGAFLADDLPRVLEIVRCGGRAEIAVPACDISVI